MGVDPKKTSALLVVGALGCGLTSSLDRYSAEFGADGGGDRVGDAQAEPDAQLPRGDASSRCGEGGATCDLCQIAQFPIPNSPGSGAPNPARYTADGGLVVDRVTGLTWQRVPGNTDHDHVAATDICACLELEGGGWRLPTQMELFSIVDHAQKGARIDPVFEMGTGKKDFWGAQLPTGPFVGAIVHFQTGTVGSTSDPTDAYGVRCVRPIAYGAPGPRFTTETETARDRNTQLVWERSATPSLRWDDARAYCAGNAKAGGTWRLPTVKELASAGDPRLVPPPIDTSVFPAVASGDTFWSSTVAADDVSSAYTWRASGSGAVSVAVKTTAASVRCVR